MRPHAAWFSRRRTVVHRREETLMKGFCIPFGVLGFKSPSFPFPRLLWRQTTELSTRPMNTCAQEHVEREKPEDGICREWKMLEVRWIGCEGCEPKLVEREKEGYRRVRRRMRASRARLRSFRERANGSTTAREVLKAVEERDCYVDEPAAGEFVVPDAVQYDTPRSDTSSEDSDKENEDQCSLVRSPVAIGMLQSHERRWKRLCRELEPQELLVGEFEARLKCSSDHELEGRRTGMLHMFEKHLCFAEGWRRPVVLVLEDVAGIRPRGSSSNPSCGIELVMYNGVTYLFGDFKPGARNWAFKLLWAAVRRHSELRVEARLPVWKQNLMRMGVEG